MLSHQRISLPTTPGEGSAAPVNVDSQYGTIGHIKNNSHKAILDWNFQKYAVTILHPIIDRVCLGIPKIMHSVILMKNPCWIMDRKIEILDWNLTFHNLIDKQCIAWHSSTHHIKIIIYTYQQHFNLSGTVRLNHCFPTFPILLLLDRVKVNRSNFTTGHVIW